MLLGDFYKKNQKNFIILFDFISESIYNVYNDYFCEIVVQCRNEEGLWKKQLRGTWIT